MIFFRAEKYSLYRGNIAGYHRIFRTIDNNIISNTCINHFFEKPSYIFNEPLIDVIDEHTKFSGHDRMLKSSTGTSDILTMLMREFT